MDLINLSAFAFNDLNEVLDLASDRTSGLRLDFGGGDVLFVEGFSLAELDRADVLLGLE